MMIRKHILVKGGDYQLGYQNVHEYVILSGNAPHNTYKFTNSSRQSIVTLDKIQNLKSDLIQNAADLTQIKQDYTYLLMGKEYVVSHPYSRAAGEQASISLSPPRCSKKEDPNAMVASSFSTFTKFLGQRD